VCEKIDEVRGASKREVKKELETMDEAASSSITTC
jgi:ribosomal protein L14E/L6E/L27E